MTTTTTTPEAEAYLAAVKAELADLSDAERGELLEDLTLHLAEVTADPDDATPLLVRLGSPAEYAAELRGAAGLPARGDTAGSPRAVPSRSVRAWAPVRAAERAWADRRTRDALGFVAELRPAWWVLRGYLAVVVLAAMGGATRGDIPVPRLAGSRLVGLVVIVAAVAASVRLGRATMGRAVALVVAAGNAALALAALVLMLEIRSGTTLTQYITVDGGAPYALETPFGPVTNIHPFAADGTPLEGVLLFDQDGRPLRTADQQWWADGCERVADHPLAEDGVPVEFSYPHRYVPIPGQQCSSATTVPPVPLPQFPPHATDPADASPPPEAATGAG